MTEETKKLRLNNAEKKKAYDQKYREQNADKIRERNKQYRESERGQARLKEYQQIVYHCELCDYDVKKYKKSQHEKSKNHQYFLQKSLNNEELERPDRKEMCCGVEYFCCDRCKWQAMNYDWHLHVSSEMHINRVMREKSTK